MKIDLNSLAAIARAADQQEPQWLPDFTADGGWNCPGGCVVQSFIVSADPKTVLALVDRIRELEGTVRSFARPELLGPDVAGALMRVIKKGALVP